MTDPAYPVRRKSGLASAPLVFAFHGTGGDENQLFGLVEQMLPDASVVAPRGLVQENGANRYFRRLAEGRYDMEDLALRTAQMIGFLRAERKAQPARQSYGLGYSNGANILASVLFAAPDLFDRAVLMHPLIPFSPPPQPDLAGKRILVTAGERDPICPLPMTRTLARYFQDNGALCDLHLHPGGHEIRPAELETASGFLTR
jgi:phospholipase/carboxylesterase